MAARLPEATDRSKSLPVKPLTDRERLFLEHYIETNFNASEAARRCGIKGKEGGRDESNPGAWAYRILHRPHVRPHLEQMLAELHAGFPNLYEKALRTYQDILDLDRREMFDDQGRFVGIKRLTFEQASCIRKIKFDAGVISEIEFESKKSTADAVLDRMRPAADKEDGTPGAAGIAPTPTMVNVYVMGERIPQEPPIDITPTKD